MSIPSGIQGQLLEITVVGCNRLKDTEWISRQDPYVCLEYASTKVRTRTCTDGDRNPIFNEKFVFTLIEGLREINVLVWNSNSLQRDDFIGSGKVHLHKVLSQGYDDMGWAIQSRSGRYAGEVRLILHYSGAQRPDKPHATQPHYPAAQPPPSSYPCYTPPASYPPASYPSYTPPASYPPASYPSYTPPASYPPAGYPPHSSHPPPAYPSSTYPPSPAATYPPPVYPSPTYPPVPQTYPYPPPPAYPGVYPPPPY